LVIAVFTQVGRTETTVSRWTKALLFFFINVLDKKYKQAARSNQAVTALMIFWIVAICGPNLVA